MGNLSDAIYQRTIDDFETSRKREKIRKFVSIGVGVVVTLSLASVFVTLTLAINEDNKITKQHLKQVAEKPLVYDGGQVDGCNLRYIQTAHLVSDNFYKEDILLKSDCNGSISVTPLTNSRVKKNINLSRMKLLNEDTSEITKIKK